MCLGIPGQIVAISDAENLLGIVSVSGVRREINLVCVVDDAHPVASCVGDWVLVHVGFAMSRIDEIEAARTLALLCELGEMQAELEAMQEAIDSTCHADESPRHLDPPPAEGAGALSASEATT